MKNKKVIIINEKTQEDIVSEILTESLVPAKEKVLMVIELLKKNRIIKTKTDDIDANGFGTEIKAFAIADREGQILKPLNIDELVGMLDSLPEIQVMFKDENDRKKFLKAVLQYWFDDEIKPNGMLPVNFIK